MAANTDTSPYLALSIAVALLSLPPLYIYISRVRARRKLERTGIGKNAPGFLTGVKRVAVTPEIAARIRRGEYVSPEEIAACSQAQATSDTDDAKEGGGGGRAEVQEQADQAQGAEENEWLPDDLRKPKKQAGKRGKRR